jgi:hypothetical protein
MKQSLRKADVAGAWAGINGAQSRANSRDWAFGVTKTGCLNSHFLAAGGFPDCLLICQDQ